MEMEILENAIVSTNNINVSKTDCCLGLMIMNTIIRNRRYRLKLFIKKKKINKKLTILMAHSKLLDMRYVIGKKNIFNRNIYDSSLPLL